jgi:hypothetical protein
MSLMAKNGYNVLITVNNVQKDAMETDVGNS